jgi:hypothetical protein
MRQPDGKSRAGRAFDGQAADDSSLAEGLRRAQERLRAFGEAVIRAGKAMGTRPPGGKKGRG